MIGRPKKRWEDDINDFLKQNHDETKIDETRERRIQNNNMWISIAIDRKEWTRLEEKYISQIANDRKNKVVLEQSGSGNVAVKSEVITNCCESSSSTEIQNIAMVTAVTVQRSRTR